MSYHTSVMMYPNYLTVNFLLEIARVKCLQSWNLCRKSGTFGLGFSSQFECMSFSVDRCEM